MIATALKRGIAKDADVDAATESMLTLNRAACEAMLEFDVHGCTDVTGFGLIGHAREMAIASGVTLEIDPRAVRFLPGAVDYARQGAIPGGLKNNREFASSCVAGESEFDDLLYDPQTSGRPADLVAGGRRKAPGGEISGGISDRPCARARGETDSVTGTR